MMKLKYIACFLILSIVLSFQVDAQHDNFVNEVMKDTWAYLSEHTSNHMPWSWWSDRMSSPGGDYANVTEIGLYMLSAVGAYELQRDWSPTWMQVETELLAILDQLETWQNSDADSYENSLFYQWYHIAENPPTVGESSIDQLVPSIDNAFLASSLITLQEYAYAKGYPTIADKAAAILQDMDFTRFYDESTHLFTLGDVQNPIGGYPADVYSNENRIINVVARALGQLTQIEFRLSLNALQQTSGAYDRMTPDPDDDITVEKVAWDGSYFTYIAPALFSNEMLTAYGRYTLDPTTEAQIAYAADKGYPFWGLSDCYDVRDGGYVQQGALPSGTTNPIETHPGLITPHASAMAMITSYQDAALANLIGLSQFSAPDGEPAVYHDTYGFRDCVTADGVPSYRFSALAQEWLFLSLLNDEIGLIWEYFNRNPGVQIAVDEMYGAALIRPIGTIATVGNPTYEWNRVVDATAYELYVGPADTYIPGRFFGTVPDTICSGSVCSVDLTTLADSLLTNGHWAVFINPIPGDLTSWRGPFEFTVQSPPPSVPIISQLSDHVIEWTLDGNAVWASTFYLYVAPQGDILTPVINQAVSRLDACDTWEGTTCTYDVSLSNGTNYVFYLNTAGPGGPATGGNIPGLADWLQCKFSPESGVCSPPPTEPTNLDAQVNGGNITLTWSASENATIYQVWVGTLSPVVEVYFDMPTVAALGCDVGEVCTLTLPETLITATYSWFVQAQGPGGVPQNNLQGWVIGSDFTVQ